MTREEMIRKVCDEYVSNSYMRGTGGVLCVECDTFGETIEAVNHTDSCSVGMAVKLLSEPVIEVGDVVETMYGKKDVVSQINLVSIYGDYDPYHISNLTLVRKGAKP